jgi:hypothetical protein
MKFNASIYTILSLFVFSKSITIKTSFETNKLNLKSKYKTSTNLQERIQRQNIVKNNEIKLK